MKWRHHSTRYLLAMNFFFAKSLSDKNASQTKALPMLQPDGPEKTMRLSSSQHSISTPFSQSWASQESVRLQRDSSLICGRLQIQRGMHDAMRPDLKNLQQINRRWTFLQCNNFEQSFQACFQSFIFTFLCISDQDIVLNNMQKAMDDVKAFVSTCNRDCRDISAEMHGLQQFVTVTLMESAITDHESRLTHHVDLSRLTTSVQDLSKQVSVCISQLSLFVCLTGSS